MACKHIGSVVGITELRCVQCGKSFREGLPLELRSRRLDCENFDEPKAERAERHRRNGRGGAR